MKLLTEELRKKLPPLYATEKTEDSDKMVHVKFFTPDSSWAWFALEFDSNDTFFGLVDGLEVEMGYFSLSELESVRGPWGLPIERDRYFKTTALASIPSYKKWIGQMEEAMPF